MQYFKSQDGRVYAYDDGVDPYDPQWATPGLVSMTTEEIQSYLAEQVPVVNHAQTIASRRYDQEVRGVVFNGIPLYTDRSSQNKLTAATLRAVRNPEYTVEWKCTDGSFVTLTASEILAIAEVVGDYVQACYTRESELVAALANGTYTEEMLEEGWPS